MTFKKLFAASERRGALVRACYKVARLRRKGALVLAFRRLAQLYFRSADVQRSPTLSLGILNAESLVQRWDLRHAESLWRTWASNSTLSEIKRHSTHVAGNQRAALGRLWRRKHAGVLRATFSHWRIHSIKSHTSPRATELRPNLAEISSSPTQLAHSLQATVMQHVASPAKAVLTPSSKSTCDSAEVVNYDASIRRMSIRNKLFSTSPARLAIKSSSSREQPSGLRSFWRSLESVRRKLLGLAVRSWVIRSNIARRGLTQSLLDPLSVAHRLGAITITRALTLRLLRIYWSQWSHELAAWSKMGQRGDPSLPYASPMRARMNKLLETPVKAESVDRQLFAEKASTEATPAAEAEMSRGVVSKGIAAWKQRAKETISAKVLSESKPSPGSKLPLVFSSSRSPKVSVRQQGVDV